MKKRICILLSVIMAFSFMSVGGYAGNDDADFEFTATADKTEYVTGDEICVSISVKNNTKYRIGELVTYVKYDGDVTLSSVCPEVDTDGCVVSGGADSSDLTLKVEENNPFLRGIYKFVMCISRNFVVLRQRFNNFSDVFNILSFPIHRKKVGTVTVKCNGEDTELSFWISYVNIKESSFGNTDITFDSISADEIKVSNSDKKLCSDWFYENIVNAGSNGKAPAYNFNIGGKTLRDTLSDWKFEVKSLDKLTETSPVGKESEVVFTSDKYDIKGRVEAVIYEDNATCEWTVYLENIGDKNSDKIKDFNAVEASLDLGNSKLYASLGSSSTASDFTLFEIDEAGTYDFDCREGRSSDYYMPYFNISGDKYGVCLGIGWSGNWKADIEIGNAGADITAKQETLNAKLEKGEEIRSPLVSLSFYDNKNPVKGFNTFRNWIAKFLENYDIPDSMLNVDAFFVSSTRTASEVIYDMSVIPDERYENINNFWMDAGWYASGSESWSSDRFGTWKTIDSRFPNGIKEVSDYAKSKGSGLVLWYEEERLVDRTESELYLESKNHNGWILGEDSGNDNIVWNFGDADALEYMEKFISSSLKENGVTVFREDSNFDPSSYWEYGDEHYYGGRSGICENHYVDGHYEFIDYLFADNENLTAYDCCASGGRRLDLEVIKRGIPLWRSDYNCAEHSDILEATQSMSYGISFWLPYTGTYYYTGYYIGGDYRSRTTLYQGYQVYCGDMASDAYYDIIKYKPEREMMNGNYYPISFGGTNLDEITAMQYGDENRGFAVIYKRKDVTDDKFTFTLSGLEKDAQYSVWNYDLPNAVNTVTGNELMTTGVEIPFSEGQQAIIIEYSVN